MFVYVGKNGHMAPYGPIASNEAVYGVTIAEPSPIRGSAAFMYPLRFNIVETLNKCALGDMGNIHLEIQYTGQSFHKALENGTCIDDLPIENI